ncbi:hypothetical protein J4E86_002233 [Alternaria arbusti]|uniref:uncharacterized protein n=1 Tax=Alternaria arbusti TaxID=232088 RepID=UPI00221F1723|nr:uncharacterized protein J4E86_002233 [Alternaria arbusti]KAI4960608.1 hypothetical protein J4E86_002233 [Alternaria arbusti]
MLSTKSLQDSMQGSDLNGHLLRLLLDPLADSDRLRHTRHVTLIDDDKACFILPVARTDGKAPTGTDYNSKMAEPRWAWATRNLATDQAMLRQRMGGEFVFLVLELSNR